MFDVLLAPANLCSSCPRRRKAKKKKSGVFSGGAHCSKLQCNMCTLAVFLVPVGETGPEQCLYRRVKRSDKDHAHPTCRPLTTKTGGGASTCYSFLSKMVGEVNGTPKSSGIGG